MSDAASRRYAQALLELAIEGSEVEKVGADLAAFDRLCKAAGDLTAVLRSPVFTVEERRTALEGVLALQQPTKTVGNFLRLVNDKRRMPLVPSIVEAYRALADAKAGRVSVVVQTAEQMTPALAQEVQAALERMTGKTVVLRAEVRPELIGGLVARIGDRVYDSSIRTRLENIRRSLLQSPIAQA